jgi:hypothetical protein
MVKLKITAVAYGRLLFFLFEWQRRFLGLAG